MEELFGEVSFESDYKNSKYVKVGLMKFQRNGKQLGWEIVDKHDHVCILIFNSDQKKIQIIRQLRCPLVKRYILEGKLKIDEKTKHLKFTNEESEEMNMEKLYAYELCAGLIDKNKSPEETAIAELEEECGYKISQDRLVYVSDYYNVGTGYARGAIYYAEVKESDRIGKGGGLVEEGERIEQVLLTAEELDRMMFDTSVMKTCSLLAGALWFLKKMEK